MCDEGNGCVLNFNIVFESFMREVNGRVCLHHDWYRKA